MPEAFTAQYEIIRGDAYMELANEQCQDSYEIARNTYSWSFYDFTKMKSEQINQVNEDQDNQS